MNKDRIYILEQIQKMIIKLLARSPEGRGLQLVGGYRLRFLDNSPRFSKDIDYHSPDDLEQKRDELISLFRKKLLPQVKNELQYDGLVGPNKGPDEGSPDVKTVVLGFYIKDFGNGSFGLNVDILRVEALDKPLPRTTDGVIYLTISDPDIIESKVITLLISPFFRERDMVDIFLFEDKFTKNSPERIVQKLKKLGVTSSTVTKQINRLYYTEGERIKGIANVIEDQFFDPEAVENINMGGGANAIFTRVMEILTDKLKLLKDDQS